MKKEETHIVTYCDDCDEHKPATYVCFGCNKDLCYTHKHKVLEYNDFSNEMELYRLMDRIMDSVVLCKACTVKVENNKDSHPFKGAIIEVINTLPEGVKRLICEENDLPNKGKYGVYVKGYEDED